MVSKQFGVKRVGLTTGARAAVVAAASVAAVAVGAVSVSAQTAATTLPSGSYTVVPAEGQACATVTALNEVRLAEGAPLMATARGNGVVAFTTSGGGATGEGGTVTVTRAGTVAEGSGVPATAVFSSGTVRDGQAVTFARTKDASGEPNMHIYQRNPDGELVEMVPTTVDGKTALVAKTVDNSAEGKKYHVKRPAAQLAESQVVDVEGALAKARTMARASGSGGAVATFSVAGDAKPTTCVITVRKSDGGNW